MPVVEWNGQVKITVGELTRAGQLDLFVWWHEWSQQRQRTDETLDWLYNTEHFIETDAMVAAAATRKIEVCQAGQWVTLDNAPQTIETVDGDVFTLTFPPTYAQINTCPRSLGDQWIEAATQKNGGINANLTFFTSWTAMSGKTTSEPESDATPSTPLTTANS